MELKIFSMVERVIKNNSGWDIEAQMSVSFQQRNNYVLCLGIICIYRRCSPVKITGELIEQDNQGKRSLGGISPMG